jgi:hypothetical protein
MGYMNAPPRTTVEVVTEAVGHFSSADQWSDPKARLWIFADKTAAVYVAGPDGQPIRHVYQLRSVLVVPQGLGSLVLYHEDNRTSTLTKKSCACGFGAVALAGPIEDRYAISWVRPYPDWYVER